MNLSRFLPILITGFGTAVGTVDQSTFPSPQPVQFGGLLQRVTDRTGKDVPDYLLRTCIRFWMYMSSPMIEKARTRSWPVRPTTFTRDAHRAWRKATEPAAEQAPSALLHRGQMQFSS